MAYQAASQDAIGFAFTVVTNVPECARLVCEPEQVSERDRFVHSNTCRRCPSFHKLEAEYNMRKCTKSYASTKTRPSQGGQFVRPWQCMAPIGGQWQSRKQNFANNPGQRVLYLEAGGTQADVMRINLCFAKILSLFDHALVPRLLRIRTRAAHAQRRLVRFHWSSSSYGCRRNTYTARLASASTGSAFATATAAWLCS